MKDLIQFNNYEFNSLNLNEQVEIIVKYIFFGYPDYMTTYLNT